MEYGDEYMYVDLGAERLLGAERGDAKIAVEIKSFTGLSTLTQLHAALGQYQVYLAVLEKVDPARKLYLALSKVVYDDLVSMKTFDLLIQWFNVSLVVVRIDDEEIVQWKP